MKFELWTTGYRCTGESADAQKHGIVEGDDFQSAVKSYVDTLPEGNKSLWNNSRGYWVYWGCRAYDNEQDARRSFG